MEDNKPYWVNSMKMSNMTSWVIGFLIFTWNKDMKNKKKL